MGELDACARGRNALFEYDGITQAKLLTSPEDSAKALPCGECIQRGLTRASSSLMPDSRRRAKDPAFG